MKTWQNRSPGNLDIQLPELAESKPAEAVATAEAAASDWARVPLEERINLLASARAALEQHRDRLAHDITLETGKPIKEAEGEVGAVLAKFDLTFADAGRYLSLQPVTDGPHPAEVRRRARGPAAVVAPFNFPLHLGHGAALAHLVAGNPVLLKPSPLAGNVAAEYVRLMSGALPPGVYQVVQGGAEVALELCLAPPVRSICFTGSVAAGRALSRALADEYDKELALELGGKNPAIVLEDADLDAAAQAIADGMCLTAGQRCNATSRLLVDTKISASFLEMLARMVKTYQPGDPLSRETKLGPLISETSFQRYQSALEQPGCEWILRGDAPGKSGNLRGYYVTPSIVLPGAESVAFFQEELFSPLLVVEVFKSETEAISKANASPYGLTASVFTRSKEKFDRFSDTLSYSNLYANLPTTFSPSTLPFGGFGLSGNRRPGGRGFIRFTTDEQAVQMAGLGW